MSDRSFRHAAEVSPSNTEPQFARSLYVGGAGNVQVQMDDGEIVTFTDVPAGTELTITVQKIMTDTSANNIVRMW